MAKVTMEGYEYVKLVKDAALVESLIKTIAGGYEIRVGADNQPHIRTQVEYPKMIQQAILTHIAEQLINNPEALRFLYDNEQVILDWSSGYFTYNYGNRINECEIALADDTRIAEQFKQWDLKKEQEEEE